jgi:hypothetical protein
MTVEQDNAMLAVLRAVTEALKTGLTKSQIIDGIEAEGVERYSKLRPEPTNDAPQRYGWSPLAAKNK